jgi:murein DD-endopeptidase MepM/ murein hydrolase activator NlpD
MSNKKYAFLALTILIILMPTGFINKSPASDDESVSFKIKVSQFPKEVLAGDALVITLTSEKKASGVTGSLYGSEVFFFKDSGEKNTFHAFVGIDISQKENKTELSFKVDFTDDIAVDYKYYITVKGVEYPEEKLTVDKKMVEPPEELLKRIKEEREAVLEIYSKPMTGKVIDSSFIRPLNTEISSLFGKRRSYNGIKKAPHNGIDLRGPIGLKIKSSNSGKIVLARNLYFTGNTVIIDHGLGVFTAYFHLNKLLKKEGSDVKKGGIIGTVGMTGRVTGPHLHFGVKLNGHYINPLSFLSLTEMIFNKDDVSAKNDLTE